MTKSNASVAVVSNEVAAITKAELLGNIGLTIQDIKNSYAVNATDAELAIFLDQAAANNLDPRKKEIYFVKYGNSAGNCIVGYQTYIARANRTGLLDGWSAELIRNSKDAVIAATVTIHRKDWDAPFTWTVEREEFDTHKSIWVSKPGFMLKKVCIAQAFRLAFPNELGAMPYTSEEVSTFAEAPDQMPAQVAIPVTADSAAPKAAAKATAPKAAAKAKAPTAAEKKAAAAKDAEAKLKPKAAASLDPELIAKVLGAFDGLGITEAELVTALGETDTWTEKNRVALLASYKEIKSGQVSKEDFLDSFVYEAEEVAEADEVLPPEVPETPEATEEFEAPEAPELPEPPADALSAAVVAKILSAFSTQNISEVELVQAVGSTAMWGEEDRVSLLAAFKEIKAGKVTKEEFLSTTPDDF